MTEEWRDELWYLIQWRVSDIPEDIAKNANRIESLISQQKKESAREALEAAAREIENIMEREGKEYLSLSKDFVVAIIRKHIEEI
jgi:hypothetical protein